MTELRGGSTVVDAPPDASGPPIGHHRTFRRSLWASLVLLVIGGLAALAALPTRAWMSQHDQMTRANKELAQLQTRNAQLQTELEHLQSPQANDDVARKELGLVRNGERALAVLPAPKLTVAALPAEWPYTVLQKLATTGR